MGSDPVARKMKLDSLKARIERADYEVDPGAVAEALIRRIGAERTTAGPPAVSRRGARSRGRRAARRPR